MFLLMICNFGPNFMFIQSAKLELFKKQVLLTSAFFGFCGFSQNWQNLNLSNTDFHFYIVMRFFKGIIYYARRGGTAPEKFTIIWTRINLPE